MKMEVNLTAEEVGIIVAEYLETKFKNKKLLKTVDKVEFVIVEREVGTQMQPYKKHIFSGVKCVVNME